MTRETFMKAYRLDHDLTILKEIKSEQDKNHWVGFRIPTNDILDYFWTSEFQDDFQEFIIKEIEKANKILEEL